jgi:hypothetical protein
MDYAMDIALFSWLLNPEKGKGMLLVEASSIMSG